MMRFGGSVTLIGLIVYIAYNLEKILLGRWWGAQAVGLYGRAYQLINIPTDGLNTAAGEVRFPRSPVFRTTLFVSGVTS